MNLDELTLPEWVAVSSAVMFFQTHMEQSEAPPNVVTDWPRINQALEKFQRIVGDVLERHRLDRLDV
jgi:hypothetical protein